MRGTNNRTYALQPAYDFVCFNRNELVIVRLPFPDYFTLSLKQNNETAKEFDETPFEEILPPFYFTRTDVCFFTQSVPQDSVFDFDIALYHWDKELQIIGENTIRQSKT